MKQIEHVLQHPDILVRVKHPFAFFLIFIEQALLLENDFGLSGDGLSRVNDLHTFSRDFPDLPGEEGIMRAPQDQLINIVLEHGFDIFFQEPGHLRGFHFSVFNQVHQAFPNLLHHLDPCGESLCRLEQQLAFKRSFGRQHPNHLGFGVQGGGFDGRLNPYDGNLVVFPQIFDRIGGCRVAGHYDQLALVLEKELRILDADLDDLLFGFAPVGSIFAVRQVNGVLMGQQLVYFIVDGQPAQTGIKYAYRILTHESLKCYKFGSTKYNCSFALVPKNLLENINTPSDLKRLQVEDLDDLASELRAFIIDVVSTKMGHLGASLGVVELTIALHYVFDTPDDLLVWDVGHQAYPHKILTGRRNIFHTNRQLNGISGFPSREESPYDPFGTGHSSTSISAVLGMAIASGRKGHPERQHIAVIGDASIASGMAFEGLNHAGVADSNILIVLNDNEMGIDPNVGALKNYLTAVKKGKDAHQKNIFEALDLTYSGPVDGHDVTGIDRGASTSQGG